MDSAIFDYKECFCADGFHGPQCEHENRWGPGGARIIERSEFSELNLGTSTLLWRLTDDDEVEMMMTAPTTSWLGLGWRPQNTDKTCFNFPSNIARYRGSDFHAMDCMDMVIGAARDGFGRVADYYTRDRSTPRLDDVWVSYEFLNPTI